MTSIFINKKVIEQTLSFEEYLAMIDDIMAHPIRVGGEGIYTSSSLVKATVSNAKIIRVILDRITLHKKIYNLLSKPLQPMIWLTFTEPWCGDAAHIVPLLSVLSECSEDISFRLLLRDKHIDLMETYFQTNGNNAIPKLVCVEAQTLQVLFTWGPRPQLAQEQIERLKKENIPKKEIYTQLHKWYDADKTISTQLEIYEQLKHYKLA